MSSKAAASGLVIFLLSESVLWAQNDWGVTYPSNQICALKGSTVEIHSTYRYPSRINDRITTVEETFWFTKGQDTFGSDLATDSQYTGRVAYHLQDNKCTLRITDLSESDSAVYKFRFLTNQERGKYTGLAGVTLSVTDLKVQVEQSSTQSEMKCHSSCNVADNGSYVWYNNGQKMDENTSSRKVSVNDKGNYSCAVQGYEDYRSPPVYIPKLPSVSVCPSGEIVEGSAVSLTCSTDANSPATYTWYKTNGNPDVQALSKEPLLVFRSIQPSDSGEYYCMVESKLGKRASVSIFIDVKYAPKLASVSVSPSSEIMEGSTVNLTCSSDANPAVNYTWYKENQTLLQGPEGIYRFTSISSENRGFYQCKSENQHGEINSSSVFIDIQYAPRLPFVSVSPSSEIMEGSTVNLTCSSDANPAANYTWYKENQTLLQGPEGIYRFTSISSENRGFYQCKSENQHGEINSSSVFIDIQYAPRLPFVSVSPSGEIIEGSAVNLTCSSDANPAANYTWYKENEDSPKASGQNFTITDIRPEHSGNYYCEAHNKRGRHNSTLHLPVVAGAWKLIAAATVPAVSLVILLISVLLWIIKKRVSKQPSGAEERPDNREQMQPVEQQSYFHYASVRFSKNQPDPIYSNIRAAPPRRYKENKREEEMVEYTAVTFNSASTARRTTGQEAAEDPSTLYSTINKHRKHHGKRNP
ncbi:B-cell receptor CD22-like [Chaetodon auriga]|uniref:B-cell receptor CD22-like n=1 Tax=Chaetodon auriga TaxID=39042 RepID=UPI004032FA22